jgi:D-glycero-D-manno-heptose 1,7-bisphosphate phosphatase
MQMERMWDHFVYSGAVAMTTVYSNKDGYSRNSVRVGEDGFIELFDRSRTSPGLSGIEISYAILTRPALDLLPDHDALVEEALYPPLAAKHELLAYVTDHRYYSVGSVERLALTEDFLARRPTVLLDRDGVLNRRPAAGEYVTSADGFQWLPGAREALRLFAINGYRVIVVSNQAGIARGALTEADLACVHEQMIQGARAAGGRIDAVYVCPHHWDEGCDCRKPKPGLLFRAQREFNLDLTRTYFVGDDSRDGEAARSAGAPFVMVTPQRSLLSIAEALIGCEAVQLTER